MKAEPILAECYRVKEKLAVDCGCSVQRLCARIEQSMTARPRAVHEVHSADELAALVAREEPLQLAAIPEECFEPYRIHDPIIAEIHRIREQLAARQESAGLILKDRPPRKP